MKRKTFAISVRKSAIHGRGVFAEEPIPEGARIIEYTGEKIDDTEGARRDAFYNSIGHTLLFKLSKTYLDGLIGGSDAIYINHSAKPNAEAIEDRGRLWIEALRDIEPGEEITFDYGYDLEAFVRDAKNAGGKRKKA